MSKIELKINKKPDIKQCTFLCDNQLAEHLNNYDLTKFINSSGSANLLCGKPGQGKTSLLYSLFESKDLLKKCYETIWIFQPSTSRASMKDKLFEKLPPSQLFDELTEENLNVVMSSLDGKHNVAIIFDDVTTSLKDTKILKQLKKLLMNRRHLHASCFFLSQTFKSVPKELRKLFTNIFLFRVSKDTLNDIFDEILEHKKEDILAISKLVFNKPYQYLFINTDSQRLFKNFDEIIINEE